MERRAHKFIFLLLILVVCAACSLAPYAIEPALPARNLAVVFDVDGTLTSRVRAIRHAREGAAAAVRAYADAGYTIIYLSARHPLFQWQIPGWLERNGFPQGPIHVTETREQGSDHASFKYGVLEAYRARDWLLVAGYGDSSTDFEAYAKAGIEPGRVFALRRDGAEACEPGIWELCFSGWPEQMGTIEELVSEPH